MSVLKSNEISTNKYRKSILTSWKSMLISNGIPYISPSLKLKKSSPDSSLG